MRKTGFFIFLFIFLSTVCGFSWNTITIALDYNMPLNNELSDDNLSVGGTYHFWGIFGVSIDIYTEIIKGGDNILGIEEFRPLGLFSWAIEASIPLGGFYFDVAWYNFYNRTDSGIESYCDAYKLGFHVDISDTFGIEFYKLTLYGFEDADEDQKDEDVIDMIGIGVMFYLL